jgi:outer membrane receptor protein involved in Fe transport
LEENLLKYEIGAFGWNRSLAMLDILNSKGKQAYIAMEHTSFDGPFDSPQNFSRLNIYGKYSTFLKNGDLLSTSISHFDSSWNASGQIPQRAVDQGFISRFGAVDNTEGGMTSRDNLNLSFVKVFDDQSFIKGNAFYSAYQFLLFSNFTFFLEDPINGDQIKQQESRSLYGLNLELNRLVGLGTHDLQLHMGTGFRKDNIRANELSHTLNREDILNKIQFGDVFESNIFAFADAEISLGKLMLAPGLRVDHFLFAYADALRDKYLIQRVSTSKISPKMNFLYTKNRDVQYFFKTGMGFHSNDTRVVTSQQGKDILPAAYGADLGVITKISPNLVVNAAAWYLYLQQEFVYVGDAGIVEPSGKTQRYGVDLGVRLQAFPKVFFDTDLSYTIARSLASPKGMNYIPLAPDFTATGGLNFVDMGKFTGGIRFRYLDNRPANEDGSIIARGYFLADINLKYRLTDHFEFRLSAENLFDTAWNETQFATESRLKHELAGVEEIHFTPGTPFFIKTGIDFKF